jgi:hypothetical protein
MKMGLKVCGCSIFQGTILIFAVTVAERSKALTFFARADAGTMGSNPLWAWMFNVCVVCAFFCVCVQVEALR